MARKIINLTTLLGVLGLNGTAIASASNPLPTAESTAAGAPNAATLPANAVQIGGVGKDTAPTAVTDNRAVRWWLSRAGVGYQALTDAAGATVATIKAASTQATAADPGLVVDVRAGLTRALGFLTGVNNTSAATAANPVPVGLSDGSTSYTGTKTAQLPTAVGQALPSASLPVTMPKWTIATFASLATAGLIVVNAAGTFRLAQVLNNTVSSAILQLHDSGLPSAGAVPLAISGTSTAGGNASLSPNGEAGIYCSTKITIATSTTANTFTATSATTFTGFTATG